ncbi:unnamed protein product [Polarella glacialis]|uniref:Uncharacterized protein n=1 Tax=Polarella glacialis TaxID=89957 RepID=A0A813L4K9_POLGL|nr:unnamed protein product [Polarella glacialis]CAE8722404.1 unnamed protein product [Polarella glacialis]
MSSLPGNQLCTKGVGSVVEWPRVSDHLFGPHPPVYDYAIPITGTALVIIAGILVPHLWNLWSAKPAQQQRVWQTRTVAAVPLVIALFKFLALVAPHVWKLLFLLIACFEVLAFWSFLKLILGFVGSSDNDILEVLQRAAPTRMWTSPPLGCFFRACVTPRLPEQQDLLAIRVLVWQFIVLAPATAAAEMSGSMPESVHLALGRIEVASLLLAMYGLFAMMAMTYDVLEHYRCYSKFWMIKGTFIANTAIFRIARRFMQHDVLTGNTCYAKDTLAGAWAGVLTVVICLPLSVLCRYAFTSQDFEGYGLLQEEAEPKQK